MKFKFGESYTYVLDDLIPGDVYMIAGETSKLNQHVFMKLRTTGESRFNSVDLTTGELYQTYDGVKLYLYDATLELERQEV